jgi:hypothetical protein
MNLITVKEFDFNVGNWKYKEYLKVIRVIFIVMDIVPGFEAFLAVQYESYPSRIVP